jgi:hypothetical protein
MTPVGEVSVEVRGLSYAEALAALSLALSRFAAAGEYCDYLEVALAGATARAHRRVFRLLESPLRSGDTRQEAYLKARVRSLCFDHGCTLCPRSEWGRPGGRGPPAPPTADA